MEVMREFFEECYKKKHKNCDMPKYRLGGYKLAAHEIAWEMWQAAQKPDASKAECISYRDR